MIYRYCDGTTTFQDFLAQYPEFNYQLISFTLDLLQKANLIEIENYQSIFKGISRREAIRKIGVSSAIALPIIFSIAAPSAVAAASICAPGLLANGTYLPNFCSVSDTFCTSGSPVTDGSSVCCSRMAITTSQPCPYDTRFRFSCQCA
ncbi:MAG: hypothetical protein HC846_14440 [Blastocatellia bacterium]|nr:hypothetical protein [Blastocatellia bacterium]